MDTPDFSRAASGLLAHLDRKDIHTIQKAAQFSMPLGNDRFKTQIETALGRAIGYTKRGRPSVREDEAMYFK